MKEFLLVLCICCIASQYYAYAAQLVSTMHMLHSQYPYDVCVDKCIQQRMNSLHTLYYSTTQILVNLVVRTSLYFVRQKNVSVTTRRSNLTSYCTTTSSTRVLEQYSYSQSRVVYILRGGVAVSMDTLEYQIVCILVGTIILPLVVYSIRLVFNIIYTRLEYILCILLYPYAYYQLECIVLQYKSVICIEYYYAYCSRSTTSYQLVVVLEQEYGRGQTSSTSVIDHF